MGGWRQQATGSLSSHHGPGGASWSGCLAWIFSVETGCWARPDRTEEPCTQIFLWAQVGDAPPSFLTSESPLSSHHLHKGPRAVTSSVCHGPPTSVPHPAGPDHLPARPACSCLAMPLPSPSPAFPFPQPQGHNVTVILEPGRPRAVTCWGTDVYQTRSHVSIPSLVALLGADQPQCPWW